MSKTLCKSKKARKANTALALLEPSRMAFACRKCKRLADAKKKLCKPQKV